jgi:hypothetical protein
VSRALPNARGPGPAARAYRDAGTPHAIAAIRFVDYMLGLSAVLILHCRLTGATRITQHRNSPLPCRGHVVLSVQQDDNPSIWPRGFDVYVRHVQRDILADERELQYWSGVRKALQFGAIDRVFARGRRESVDSRHYSTFYITGALGK